jgi:hypothetical protein
LGEKGKEIIEGTVLKMEREERRCEIFKIGGQWTRYKYGREQRKRQ